LFSGAIICNKTHQLTHTPTPGHRRHRLHNLLMALHARDPARLAHALPQNTRLAHRPLEPDRRRGLHPLRRAGLRERLLKRLRDRLAVVHLHRVVGLPGTSFHCPLSTVHCAHTSPGPPPPPPIAHRPLSSSLLLSSISEDIPACGGTVQPAGPGASAPAPVGKNKREGRKRRHQTLPSPVQPTVQDGQPGRAHEGRALAGDLFSRDMP